LNLIDFIKRHENTKQHLCKLLASDTPQGSDRS
jgi:hypothetical protein